MPSKACPLVDKRAIIRITSATGLPWPTRTSTCRSLPTISSGVFCFLEIPSSVRQPAIHDRRRTLIGSGHTLVADQRQQLFSC